MQVMVTGMINNIFFIIFPIIIYQVFSTAGTRNYFVSHRIKLTIMFSISIVLCLLFPYQILAEEYIFDLRQVPMIVGALYGGFAVSATLFIVSAMVRILIGGDGMYIAIANLFLIALIVPFLRPLYMRINRLNKAVLVFVISIFSLLFNMLSGYIFFGHELHEMMGIWTMIILNQGVLIIVTALLIEHFGRQEMLLNTVMKHEKLETVSHFAASVSHELRNPLQSIKGFVQLLETKDYPREKQLEFYETILEEVEAAERLIDDYLLFAKPTYGEVEKIDVDSEIDQVLKVMNPFASWQNVDFHVDKSHTELIIKGDPRKFHQAIINILRNGIEAMPSGGVFRITTALVLGNIRIELKDEGVGMTKEQVKRIGEPYFSNKIKGTGLGMMVTYSIIRQMDGEIEIESELNKGTCFRLIFPAFYD
ncbi:two-component sensor histidine kinase [Planomicrobium sp. YIM 101495]|nr:two-component sensor histidine kinase [Planomicrobium sp. YIM 101495]